jgi:heme-degrading monooxygenase HmoA
VIYTLFFSRMRDLTPRERAEYAEWADALRARARSEYPGFVDLHTYTADDGERLTVVRFRDEGSQRPWKVDPLHRRGQAHGRALFYDSYRLVVCELVRERGWVRASEAEAHTDEGGGG